MKPRPDSSVDNLLAEVVRHVEVPYRVQVPRRPGRVEAVDIEVDLVRAEEGGEHLDQRRSNRAVGHLGYSGWLGVVMSGSQPVCSTVAGLPSS